VTKGQKNCTYSRARRYFNVRSKAGRGQLNLPHGTNEIQIGTESVPGLSRRVVCVILCTRSRFDTKPACDRQTDRRTDGQTHDDS